MLVAGSSGQSIYQKNAGILVENSNSTETLLFKVI